MRPWIVWVLHHERLVLSVVCVLALAGVAAVMNTPIDALPDLSENQVLVYSPWPGQRPPEIERRVTRPLSAALQGIPGLVSVRGSSELNFSLLHLIFDDGISFQEARARARARLAAIDLELPAGVTAQLAADGIPTGQIFWYTVEGRETDLVELRRLQDDIVAPQLRTVAGVAEVASVGGFHAEYHLQLDLEKLAASQVSIADLEDLKLLTSSPSSIAGEPDTIALASGKQLQVDDVGRIVIGTSPRSGLFEKDGTEVVAGIVHLRYGHNPLTVTRNVLDRIQQITDRLPSNVRLVPCYDRTPLILGAVQTVTRTLLEAMLVTALCVILVLRHWGTSLVISVTLPLAVLGAFLWMAVLSISGVTVIQTNIMSLAGIVVSIGVLVDSAIVMTDSVSHQLRAHFGDQPVTGDTREIVATACAKVGWPAFLAILVMLVSFLPVFALQGIDGRMYGPLAWTKALSLLSVAVLTVSVVPVLCHKLIRDRIRAESESAIVRGFADVYRPMLEYLLDRPLPLIGLLSVTLILGAAATGNDWLVRTAVGVGLAACWRTSHRRRTFAIASAVVLLAGLAGPTCMRPIGLSLRVPLDEGMVMDMPITVPNISIAQAGDDLKARNMILCRFPEVAMVSGKAGRAETAFDPAPLDMIETMVEFRPTQLWPHRRLLRDQALSHAMTVVEALQRADLVEASEDLPAIANQIVDAGLPRFDAIAREVCWQRWQVNQAELGRELAIALTQSIADRLWREHKLQTPLSDAEVRGIASELPLQDIQRLGQRADQITIGVLVKLVLEQLDVTSEPNVDGILSELQRRSERRCRTFVRQLNFELRGRAAKTWTQIVCGELVTRRAIKDDALRTTWTQILQASYATNLEQPTAATHDHAGIPPTSRLPIIDPHRQYDRLIKELNDAFAKDIWLWPHDRGSLTVTGAELDVSVMMPGWANVWTRPIQNRVDMLASGVNSEVGVRIMGDDFDSVVKTSEAVANVIRMVPGATDVIADPIRGKDYTHWTPDEQQLLRLGLTMSDATDVEQLFNQGRVIGTVDGGTNSLALRLYLIGSSFDRLGIVTTTSGPATIKSEGGRLRNYVRFNVRGGDPNEVIAEAKTELARQKVLPAGIELEWTGQFEHAARTRARLVWLVPLVLLLIGVILYAVFRDAADAALMLMSVPGALAGGAMCQWLLGVPFSVAVGVGYITCFGMAAATSMIMLVYLRESVASAGDFSSLSAADLRGAVINGAVQRLRPKLLTEATMIFSLAPMLWSDGAGADVIRPMAAPVLGGILVADEVVDLLIPILFYRVRKQRQKKLAKQEIIDVEKL